MTSLIRLSIALLSTAAYPLFLQAADVDIYTKSDLAAIVHGLTPKGPVAADKALGHYSNHYFLVAKRDETGSAEVHEHEADVFVVESGEATIQTGGEIVNGHATKPGEIRGTAIKGGEQHALATGDIIHIPAGVPHRLLVNKGKPFAYFVVKVAGQ